jgi:hypothetical protein
VVELKVPPGTTPGSYSFRLDAVSEDDPDEDFTEGPSVAFDVTAPPPPPPKKKFPWWILAIVGAFVLLIIIGVVIWLLVRDGGSESATVPAVVGQTSGAAQSALTSAGYTFSVSEAGVAEPQQDGIVQSQDPAAGTPHPRGTAVAIVVGRNVVVPNVVNLAQDQALALLRGARLEPSVVRVHVPVPFQIGIVGRQTPQGGTRLPLRGQVTIFVNVFP